MSARAAWRLETLGVEQVFRYAPGKEDWMAAGLPIVGSRASIPRVGSVARRDVPKCRPDAGGGGGGGHLPGAGGAVGGGAPPQARPVQAPNAPITELAQPLVSELPKDLAHRLACRTDQLGKGFVSNARRQLAAIVLRELDQSLRDSNGYLLEGQLLELLLEPQRLTSQRHHHL